MMKKVLSMICAVAICLGMAGCGGNGVEKNAYNAAKQAIEVADDYLDFKITADEADEKIERLYDRLSGITFENEKNKEKARKKALDVNSIQIALRSLDMAFSKLSGSDAKVLKARNNLAEYIGMSEK